MPSLSVVLICKNQAWNMGRLIESVLKETAGSADVIVVDSASTDSTIETTRQYPISILRLKPDQRLTPAAGRYIGYANTAGDLILFLDGDMALYPGWLLRGISLLESDNRAAAVTGVVINQPKNTRGSDGAELSGSTDKVTQVRHGGGAALYRRSVLEQVGTFDPSLYSDEEPELCIRIRHAGYRILKTEYPIAYHYSDPDDALATLIARWRRRLYLGAGQNLRRHLGTPIFLPYLRERGFGCVPGLGIAGAGIALTGGIAFRRWYWLGLLARLVLAIFLIDAFRKRSLYMACVSFLKRLLIVDGTVRGFLLPSTGSAVRFDLIQRVNPIPVGSGVTYDR
jgi:glycosyltransferase involved in cell wall biosynthesis